MSDVSENSIAVRPAESRDVGELLQLFTEARNWQLQRNVPTFTAFTDSFMHGEIAKGAVFVAERNGRLVGSLSLYESDEAIWGDQTESALYIHRLVSARGEEGRGIGGALVRWSLIRASDLGKQWLRVDCWADNQDLCGFYVRQGFARVAVKDTGLNPALAPHYHHIKLQLFQMPAAPAIQESLNNEHP